jgi:hypothetical protein
MARLSNDIAAWDGKALPPIEGMYARHHASPRFLADTIALFGDQTCDRGATWLVKRHIENGHAVSAALTRKIVAQLKRLDHWEAKLHVLQILPSLPVAAKDAEEVAAWVRGCLTDDATFVRAWAYNGLHALAAQHSAYQAEARTTLPAALRQDQPASVKVRIRKALEARFEG